MSEHAPAVTAAEAIQHAARLLAQAELEVTNLPLIERMDQLACSWLAVANLLNERERV
ncbi:hypothetical protein ACFWNR_06410 [Streptomyces virginiae]|uniref:hypothetical protein n=1 Tax=Streptomyces virginiae TaxID=1961 RepID=UPI003659658D